MWLVIGVLQNKKTLNKNCLPWIHANEIDPRKFGEVTYITIRFLAYISTLKIPFNLYVTNHCYLASVIFPATMRRYYIYVCYFIHNMKCRYSKQRSTREQNILTMAPYKKWQKLWEWNNRRGNLGKDIKEELSNCLTSGDAIVIDFKIKIIFSSW